MKVFFLGGWKIILVCEESEAVRGLFAQKRGVTFVLNCPHGEFHGFSSFCSVPCSGLGVGIGHGFCPWPLGPFHSPLGNSFLCFLARVHKCEM